MQLTKSKGVVHGEDEGGRSSDIKGMIMKGKEPAI